MDDLLLNPLTVVDIKRVIKSSPHAIGLEGEAGSGKSHIASEIAARILGLKDVSKYPYFKFLDCESGSGIEDVREIIRFLNLKVPGDAKYKRCVAFYGFENLGHEAQNTLLKSIEEPPSDTLVIVTTDSRAELLPTIKSRLSWVNIRPVSLKNSVDYFGNSHAESDINRAYTLSGGAPALMKSLLEDYDNHSAVKSINMAKNFLREGRTRRLSLVDEYNKDKDFDAEAFLSALAKVLEAALKGGLIKNSKADKKLVNGLRKVINAQNAFSYNCNQKLVLTELIYSL